VPQWKWRRITEGPERKGGSQGKRMLQVRPRRPHGSRLLRWTWWAGKYRGKQSGSELPGEVDLSSWGAPRPPWPKKKWFEITGAEKKERPICIPLGIIFEQVSPEEEKPCKHEEDEKKEIFELRIPMMW
jgi:hypothetical protein